MDTKESRKNLSDVMTALLNSSIFHYLSPVSLQKIIRNLEAIHFKKGDTIIKQGEEGDYFYVIKNGQCLCSRKSSPTAKEIKLRTLTTGDIFGEDALITNAKRALTITALSDIALLRMSKQNFLSLIKEQALIFVNNKEMQEAIQQGSILLDVRAPDAYQKNHLDGSINKPFFLLRAQLSSLNPDKTFIIVCENGRVSEAAAFLLINNKISAKILQGGMDGIVLDSKAELSINQLESVSSDNFRQVFFQHFEPSIDDCCWQIEIEFGFQLGENRHKLSNARYSKLLKYLHSIRSEIKQNYLLKVHDIFDSNQRKTTDAPTIVPGFSKVSIMSDIEVEEDYVIAAIILRCEQMFSGDLIHLNKRFRGAQGQLTFTKQNPILPENLIQALVEAVKPLKLNTDSRITLYKTFEVNVFSQLGFIYRQLSSPN